MGLSPRVRGKRHRKRISRPSLRSIPACAGETVSVSGGDDAEGVYPRVCGGNTAAFRFSAPSRGLSPRVRGKRGRPIVVGIPIRSIPACAGETHSGGRAAALSGVYPRVCGGNHRVSSIRSYGIGLSPRVRGKPQRR